MAFVTPVSGWGVPAELIHTEDGGKTWRDDKGDAAGYYNSNGATYPINLNAVAFPTAELGSSCS